LDEELLPVIRGLRRHLANRVLLRYPTESGVVDQVVSEEIRLGVPVADRVEVRNRRLSRRSLDAWVAWVSFDALDALRTSRTGLALLTLRRVDERLDRLAANVDDDVRRHGAGENGKVAHAFTSRPCRTG